MYFLSGLPRSGSTLLAAILNQHPQLHVSSTSPLIDLMGAIAGAWEQNPSVQAQGRDPIDGMLSTLRAVMNAHTSLYDKPVYMDKSRGWPAPKIMTTMAKVLNAPIKIVATVRHIPDCVASFVRVAMPRAQDVQDFLLDGALVAHLKQSYVTLQEGFSAAPDNFHFVDYDALLDTPTEILAGVLAFLELKPFVFDLMNIEGETVAEHDEAAWGVSGMHDVKPVFKRQHTQISRDVLGDFYTSFLQPEFWKPNAEPPAPQILDLQRDANLRGEFDKGLEYATILELASPTDDRAAFNRGFHLLRAGDLQGGMKCLHRGRVQGVFGDKPVTGAPLWDGSAKQTVLLALEGGYGDQIHGVRFAKEIAAKGCKVIVSASMEICEIFSEVEGMTAVCTKAAGGHVWHESWVPSESAPIILGWGWGDVKGDAYLGSKRLRHNRIPRIGLRWSGNPRFEHEQHRHFPPEGFFQAVFRRDCDFICLQRDEGAEFRPEWCREVPLGSWQETMAAVQDCDLVISSCTSVAHLAGAMGVKTWVVTPIMPYYLWSLPGDATPWYNAMTLFRQTDHTNWRAPMMALQKALTQMMEGGYGIYK